jgi:ERF superfamily protein
MHRCSESTALIATALAKAQIELTNPEKAMIGSVYNNRSDSHQSFRYASLSSGLDIARKILGGQQIAITQTTAIDRESSTISLTTTLLHTSGEWISSDWPVCRTSEISAPRRMGACLTYARRYALFTMVGIAGEDDLDAQPNLNDPAHEHEAGKVDISPDPVPSPTRSRASQAVMEISRPILPKLSIEESAGRKGQLILEIESLSEEDLQPGAISILKAKNLLSADDAKSVEKAFAARVALQDAPAEEPAAPSNPKSPQHLPASTAVAKPTRQRLRTKGKTAIEPPPAVVSEPIRDLSPMMSPASQTKDDPAKIQKSGLWISEPRRHRDKAHLRYVASQPCLVCGRSPADAHHLRFAQPRAMGCKVSDEFTVPLCRAHHRDNHSCGDEVAWWERRSIDPLGMSRTLWLSTHKIE